MTDREFLLALAEKTPPTYLDTDDDDKLLLQAGASHRIRNCKGELPRQVPREKFKLFFGRANDL